MSLTVAQLTSEAMQLSVVSRAELVDKLVESLDFSADDELRALWAVEAKKRRDDVRSGRVKTISGEAVFAEIRQILAK